MMVVTARRNKSSLISYLLNQFKPEKITVKRKRSLEIRDFKMDVSDPCIGMNAQFNFLRIIDLSWQP